VNRILERANEKILKEKGVRHFSAFSELKASIVERFNRTLKQKMWKYFTQNNTLRYVDVSDQLIYSCNHTFHRSIGMASAQVNYENEESVWHTLCDQTLPKVKPKFKRRLCSHFQEKRNIFKILFTKLDKGLFYFLSTKRRPSTCIQDCRP